jgi:Heterokaryon incompatibility protein (HET)
MQFIYNEATQVLLRLGDHEQDSEAIMQSLPVLIVVLRFQDKIDHFAGVYQLEARGLPGMNSGFWVALGHLLHHPWFQRVWTIQEVARAKKTTIVCGGNSATWKGLEHLDSQLAWHVALMKYILELVPRLPSHNARTALEQVPEIVRLSYKMSYNLTYSKFLSMLDSFRDCKATDPRDKVYSLLGLLQDSDVERFDAPGYTLPV